MVVVGAAVDGDKVSLVAATNEAGPRRGGLGEPGAAGGACGVLGGRGGGKDDMAQGGGTGPTQVEAAFAAAVDAVRGAAGA